MKAKRKEFELFEYGDIREENIKAAEAFVTSCGDKLIAVFETTTMSTHYGHGSSRQHIVVWYWTE